MMDDCDLESLPWFPPLMEQVQAEMENLVAERRQQRPVLQRESAELKANIQGWSQSLAKLDLDPALRADIEVRWTAALNRQREIEQALAEEDARRNSVAQAVDRQQIVDRLNRLADVLASNNPTLGNLELSHHIERIETFPDGRIVMRTSKLGALADVADLICRETGDSLSATTADDVEVTERVPLRRRARLRVVGAMDAVRDLKAAVDTAIDPYRFAGLDDSWFWEDTFQVPEPTSWTKENAAEVARVRATGLTMARLASHFGKSVPTIRNALKHAASADESARKLPKRMPPPSWAADHAAEVATLKANGMSTAEISRRYGKSQTTIRESLAYASRCHA